LLRDGLTRMLRPRPEIGAAVDNGEIRRRRYGRSARPRHRRHPAPAFFTDEGLRAALAARKQVRSTHLGLSQYVEQLYARKLLADGTGGPSATS